MFAKTEEETLRINNILQSNVFFSHLDEHQRRALGDSMFVVESRDGDTIISQNDDGDNMYLIDEGRVECYIQKDNEEERILVKTLGDGDLFGELALLYSAPRAATCIAKGEASLFALDRVSFNVILQQTTIAKREKMVAFLKKVPVMRYNIVRLSANVGNGLDASLTLRLVISQSLDTVRAPHGCRLSRGGIFCRQ